MPELSLEFWIASAIAVIALALGLGVTLAMDAKTKGEFNFAVGSFIVSAAIAVYGIEVLQMRVTWPAGLRVLVTYILIAGCVTLTGEAIRWAYRRHRGATTKEASKTVETIATVVNAPALAAPPIVKTDTFSTLVPINTKAPNVPVPMDENLGDPRSEFYSDLLGLAGRPENAEAAGWHISGPRRLDTEDDRFRFVTRLMQFYVFRSIYYLHRSSRGVKITVGEGVRPISRKAIIAPNAVPHDSGAILKPLSNNEFLHPGDEMVMKAKPLSLPVGTTIRLFEEGADPRAGKLFTCVVRLERPKFFRIDFIVQPSFGTGLGNLPAKFQSRAIAEVQTYTVTITMNAEIQTRRANDFDADSYAAWGQALFDGMEKQMGFE